ncbi:malate dehydrogenase (oxaloacetate-decarboxylating) [Natronospira proteinivora]|uniref:Malate dehydrogenase (Oxaloacetate-decarboxylating) n=1 Tax=Natronospira proteinivora TaxID=1807133 RepID=A0ABT1G9P2_9GAMM|nr:malic enzyme-like NAD(P)-binding protein [Natronospira proteinivora]MCP1728045.1 malate dehydrogenase (oxaloacetate-decarboxylating) [Natronospira proteinivora]
MKIPEILLVESHHKPGSLAKILQVIGDCGLVVEHLNAIRRDQDKTVWEITLEMDEDVHYGLYEKLEALPNARLLGKSDRVFNRHRGGKIRMHSRLPIATLQELRDIYTPGVARVCLAIRDNPWLAREYTYLNESVAIVTNGTAILGLGDIGPVAGMPVMEGKAALFDKFVGLSGIPILLEERDPDRLVEHIVAMAPSFGAIQLEDIAAPACFEVEEKLKARLTKPVLHDDQHGTAVVTLAALMSAAKRVGTDLTKSVVGQIGLGSAGIGIARLLQAYGVEQVVGADLNEAALARLESMGGRRAELPDLMAECDVVIACTGVKGLIKPDWVREGQIVFALSNPDAEIEPNVALAQGAAYAADGKGINNALGFPGLFRGALDAHASAFNDAMLFAAARTLSELAPEDELVPESLDPKVHEAVARAVAEAAEAGD